MGNTCCAKSQAEKQAANIQELPVTDEKLLDNMDDPPAISTETQQNDKKEGKEEGEPGDAEKQETSKKDDGTTKDDGSLKAENAVDEEVVNQSEALEPKIINIRVKREDEADLLGMDVKHVKGNLVIVQIFSGGAVERCNLEAKAKDPPEDQLEIGDIITQVNDAIDNDSAMVAEFQSSLELNVKAIRKPVPPV